MIAGTTLSTLEGYTLSMDFGRVKVAERPVLMAGILPTGGLAGLAATAPTTASATLTSSGTNVSNNDTVTLDGQTYTFKTTLTASTTAFEVLIGASAAASLLNLSYAVGGGGTPGTNFGSDTPPHPRMAPASVTSTVITFQSRFPGAIGNTLKVAKSAATLTLSGSVLSGGADAMLSVAGKDNGPHWTPTRTYTTTTTATTTDITVAPAAGQKIYLDDCLISADAAQTVSIVEETSGTVFAKVYIPANGTVQITLRDGIKAAVADKKLRAITTTTAATSITACYHSEA